MMIRMLYIFSVKVLHYLTFFQKLKKKYCNLTTLIGSVSVCLSGFASTTIAPIVCVVTSERRTAKELEIGMRVWGRNMLERSHRPDLNPGHPLAMPMKSDLTFQKSLEKSL